MPLKFIILIGFKIIPRQIFGGPIRYLLTFYSGEQEGSWSQYNY